MKFNLLYVNHISITTRDNLIISCVCKVLLCRAYGSLCSLAIILYHIVKFPCLHCVRHRGWFCPHGAVSASPPQLRLTVPGCCWVTVRQAACWDRPGLELHLKQQQDWSGALLLHLNHPHLCTQPDCFLCASKVSGSPLLPASCQAPLTLFVDDDTH